MLPLLLRLAAPNILLMVAQSATGLIETYFVGKLGTDALAGVSIVFPGVMLMQMISAGCDGRRHLFLDRPSTGKRTQGRCIQPRLARPGHQRRAWTDLHHRRPDLRQVTLYRPGRRGCVAAMPPWPIPTSSTPARSCCG